MPTQNFKNHSQYVPAFHFVTLPLLLLVLIGSIVNLVTAVHENILTAILLMVLTVATILAAFFGRRFSLKAQDRAIRAEENFRHFAATGKPLDKDLTMGQIIALRFAGEEEFVELAKKASIEKMTSKDIKMAIRNWKGDHHRA